MSGKGTTVDDEKLLKAEEVAQRLDVPKSWVYHAARTGVLPFVDLGRYVRFRPADVQEFIDGGGQQK